MKVLAGLVVVILIALAGVYVLGGFASLSPQEQSRQLKDAAVAGTGWQAVCDVKPPRRFQAIRLSKDRGVGPVVKFNRAAFEKNMQNHSYPDGFYFNYQMSANDAFQIAFDGQGQVTGIHKQRTFNDLLSP